MSDPALIQAVVSHLRRSQSILFITGAGVSADSGLPTYRGIGGLYNNGLTSEGIPFEIALSGEMLASKPQITWKYLMQVEQAGRTATFNRTHAVIAEMEQHFPRVWVLTQNVDGFHRTAGSRNVIDIHGDMHGLACQQCSFTQTVTDYSGLKEIPPHCPECQAFLRPQVVFFGEMLARDKVQRLAQEVNRGFDLVFSVGTTSVFPYIIEPVLDAKQRGIPTVEINPDTTMVSELVDIRIPGRAAAVLDEIWKAFQTSSS
jgi:NAD-dependent deacetylase